MNLRNAFLLPLVIAAAACGRQDARPLIAPDVEEFEKSTGAVKIAVLRDTANSRTIPKWAAAGATAANGQTRVNLYDPNDPTRIVGGALTNANGEILLTGIAPGTYLLKPDLSGRPQSTTLLPPEGLSITVTAGDTVKPDTVRVRLSSRISGILSTQWLDQAKLNNVRHSGVKIRIFRETGNATNVYTLIDSVTTNGVGSYEYFFSPGPERVRLEYDSRLITNLKDSTTLSGNAPVPYVEKVEQITISGINPGRDQFGDATWLYPTRLTGTVYRDKNANGVRDAGESLIFGDTVVIQLRDSTDSRVIRTATVNTSASQSPTTNNTFTFSPNPSPGKYVLRMDKLASRFGSNPLEFVAGPAYEVRILPPTTAVVNAECRPYVAPPATNTAAFGNCNFGLVTGK